MGMWDGEWEPATVDKWFPCAGPGNSWSDYKEHSAFADSLYWWEGNDEFAEGWYCRTCHQELSDEFKELSRNAPPMSIGSPKTEEEIAYWKEVDEFFNSKRKLIDEIAELDDKGMDNLTQEVHILKDPLNEYLDG